MPKREKFSLTGRQTGATEWKASRGELGTQIASKPTPIPETSSAELQSKRDGGISSRQITTDKPGALSPTALQDAPQTGAIKEDEHPQAVQSTTKSREDKLDSAGAVALSKDEFTQQMQRLFADLMASGKHPPNEAALLALQQLKDKVRE